MPSLPWADGGTHGLPAAVATVEHPVRARVVAERLLQQLTMDDGASGTPGMIVAGGLGDDLLTIDARRIKDVDVAMTFVGGKAVYRR